MSQLPNRGALGDLRDSLRKHEQACNKLRAERRAHDVEYKRACEIPEYLDEDDGDYDVRSDTRAAKTLRLRLVLPEAT